MKAGKGKKQVQLTLKEEAFYRLQKLAADSDPTLAGYLRWVFYCYLRDLDAEEQPSGSFPSLDGRD